MVSSLAGRLDDVKITWFTSIESDLGELKKGNMHQVLSFKFFSFDEITFIQT